MINMKVCHNQNGDDVLSVILDISFASYILSSVAMILILVIIVSRRGHWAAIGLTLSYTLAFCLKGLSFTGWTNSGEGIYSIFYYNCVGKKEVLQL